MQVLQESPLPSPADDGARINEVCAHDRRVTQRGGESVPAMGTAGNIFSRSVWGRSCLPTCTWRARRALCQAQNDGSSSKDNRLNQADALTQSLSSVSSNSGRVAQTRNFVMGSDDSEASWRALDEQVNTYPGHRNFKAIGVGGDAFVQSMTQAVESVTGGPLHEECIQHRPSAKGSYMSVTLGPILVQSTDQVVDIYAAMRRDERLKWYM